MITGVRYWIGQKGGCDIVILKEDYCIDDQVMIKV